MKEFIQTAGAIIGGVLTIILFLPFIAMFFPVNMGSDIDKILNRIRLPRWLMTSGYIIIVFITLYCMVTL